MSLPVEEREQFDELLERVLAALPGKLHALMEEAPVIVDDEPSRELLAELEIDPEEEGVCGLHSGTPLIERSVTDPPDQADTIHLFRAGIIEEAGGWEPWVDEDGHEWGGPARVQEEIRITLLHEIGHHFGLEEDDLAALGYD